MRVGIARSLLYYHFQPFWSALFEGLGLEAVVSPPTSQAIMRMGLSMSVDELCLPVKVHLGHLAYLAGRTDAVLSPGFGRWGRRGWFCPKLMALPDLAAGKIAGAVEAWHDLNDLDVPAREPWRAAIRTLLPGADRRLFKSAWEHALARQEESKRLLAQGYRPSETIGHLLAGAPLPARESKPLRVAVLGHPYLVYDELLNHGLLTNLEESGVSVHTAESIPPGEREREWPGQHKRIYWPLGRHLLAAALHYAAVERVDGLIMISACLCGPDALLGELLGSYLGDSDGTPPLLRLTVDEHTGQAGLQTRIEAFLDLIKWRKRLRS